MAEGISPLLEAAQKAATITQDVGGQLRVYRATGRSFTRLGLVVDTDVTVVANIPAEDSSNTALVIDMRRPKGVLSKEPPYVVNYLRIEKAEGTTEEIVFARGNHELSDKTGQLLPQVGRRDRAAYIEMTANLALLAGEAVTNQALEKLSW